MTPHLTQHWTFRLALLIGFCFLLGFTYTYHLPKLEAFMLIEIERLTEKHAPARVWAQKLNFHLFPLGVVLEDVRIIAKPPVSRYVSPIHLKRVGARLAILPLLRGEFRLGRLYIRDGELNLFLREELFKKKSDAPFKIDFDLLYSLPVDELSLENITAQARVEPSNYAVRATNLHLMIENRFRSLYIDLDAPELLVKPGGPVVPFNVQAELRTLIEAREMQISALKLKADDAFFVASGRFNGDFATGRVDNGAVDARAKLDFSDFNRWERIFREKALLPALGGRAEIDAGLELRGGKPYKIDSQIKTEGLKIDKFYIGEIAGRAASDLKTVTTDNLTVRNDSGLLRVQKALVEFEPVRRFTAEVAAEKVQIEKFLTNIGIKNVPIELPVTGEASCQGVWDKKEIGCKAKVSTPRFHVHSGKPSNSTIVEANDLRAHGDVKITTKQVEYQAELMAGKKSSCKTTGVINYQKGFKILYDAPAVTFADVKNLANLKFEGNLALKGSTEGTSDWATIDMSLSGNELWMEDYPLGQLTTKMNYKAGHMYFTGAQGQYQVTRYSGDLEVNLRDSRLKVKAQVPFVEMKDLQSMFQRKISLPVEFSGTGTGFIEGEGPFSFRDMSYTVKSNFYRGHLAQESFDQLTFNVKSVNGLVTAERIHLTKASGQVEMKGQINRDGDIDSVVVARSLRLEQSENVLALGLDVQGLADVTLLMRGRLPKPHIELNGRFSRVVLADQPAEDSIFKLSFHENRLEGSGQFLGSKLFGDFVIPYDDQAPFLFRMKAKQWDFTTLFSLVSKSAKQLDFETSMTANINLQSARGGLWASSGQVQVEEFVIRKGANVMSSSGKPMYLVFREGVVNSSNFAVSSGDSYLKLDVANLSRDQLNASLNGKMDLALLGLLTPFISDLRGNMAISVDLRGSVANPKLSGSAYLDKGYAKFIDFIHPFSAVRADVLFNDNQILLNTVRADMAGGKLSGDGRITFSQGARTVDVKGSFQDVKINVPENFKTQGSGTVAIRGSGFPYVMDINYGVTGGEVTYEIGSNTSGAATVKASAYLPRFLYQEAFHPFTFLIDVNLRNPVLVNNSLAHIFVNGNVRATGTPDRLMLTGTLTPSPGGKVLFRDREFDVQTAFVEYNNNPPWAPRVYLTATTRVSESVQEEQGTAEHQYDVNMLVQGRGPNPDIVLSSQPPLSQREIVSLLALGVTTAAMDERRSSDFQAANTSTALGTALLQKAGSRRLKDAFGVDVKVSSSQPTPDTASTPKVTLSKQWTPKFGASASSTLNANPTNNVKVEYKMNKNVSAVGSWEGKESAQENKDSTQNVFGLDLEYKVQFK